MITKKFLQKEAVQVQFTKELTIREFIVNEIIELVDALKIEKLTGWEKIPFHNIHSIQYENYHSTAELSILLESLNNRFAEMQYQSLMEKYYL